jgi:hypothetical protein
VQPRPWLVFSALIVLTVLGACSPSGRFLLYFDPYQFEVLDGQGIDRAAIRQSLPKDLSVRIEVAPLQTEQGEGPSRFQEVIERTKPGWVYLGPAHPFDPDAIIPRYPDIRFFREDLTGASSANQIALVYDREKANYEAGRAMAALLGDAAFLQRIGVAEPEVEKPRVGILVAVNDELVQREIDAFVEGFSTLEDPQRIETKQIGNLTDRVKARRLLDGMKEEAVAIILLKTYVLSGFCLEYLAKESIVAVVEGPIPDQAYGNTVLLTLVDDFIAALKGMAESIDRESQTTTVDKVVVPLRLQWNETYRSMVTGILEGVNQR